ncbi:nucleotide exchange factor GrpE [Anaerotruncus sp.]|jgi:molecular chaperone GrpE|uniref:nucleotide exchange factor GrpE n=1 Tax=Anaerotruncus TaxID=244127 RepID=UPI00216CAFB3|nr:MULTISPECIES: nucleotide exchange factor GrpE [Anaerotruncus]MCI8492082.1 nucleotide exchange factor GrpE [Anaerotruncus sp.]
MPDTTTNDQNDQMEQEPQAQDAPESDPVQEQAAQDGEAQLQAQMADLNDRLLRTMAEYDNFRKRSQREKESIYPQATAAAVAQFIPVADTIERALAAPCTDDEYKKGVEMILQNFNDILAKMGVEAFGAPGDAFDPEVHNAVMHVEDEEAGAGSIVEVFQKGYRLGERIIRHAMVKVAN